MFGFLKKKENKKKKVVKPNKTNLNQKVPLDPNSSRLPGKEKSLYGNMRRLLSNSKFVHSHGGVTTKSIVVSAFGGGHEVLRFHVNDRTGRLVSYDLSKLSSSRPYSSVSFSSTERPIRANTYCPGGGVESSLPINPHYLPSVQRHLLRGVLSKEERIRYNKLAKKRRDAYSLAYGKYKSNPTKKNWLLLQDLEKAMKVPLSIKN